MTKKISWTNISRVDIQKVNQIIPDDYDKLNAKNAVKSIRDLELPELLAVSKHEFNSKRRKTVLRAVHSKILKNPEALALSDDYDRLNAQGAIKSIQDLELPELLIVLMHEFNSKRRKTVLRAVHSKILKNPEALALKEKYQREAQEGFTILQVGQTGVGKSSTVNSLFGEEVAKTNNFTAQTKSVTPFEGTHRNVRYTIYDTPGLGEWSIGDLEQDKKYISLMKERCPLPDVLWYVLRLDGNRITAADANALKLIHENFGDAIWDRTMIVFTHSDRFTSPKDFQESFDGRTQTVNHAITQITNGKVQDVPVAAVANGSECTPDGKNWLGELFTTSFERLNPERQNAFLLAFATDLKLPEPQSSVPKARKPKADINKEATKKTGGCEKRIELTKEHVERVKEKSVGVSDVLSKALLGAEVGMLIEGVTGGATMGAGVIVCAVIGSMAALYEWSRDE